MLRGNIEPSQLILPRSACDAVVSKLIQRCFVSCEHTDYIVGSSRDMTSTHKAGINGPTLQRQNFVPIMITIFAMNNRFFVKYRLRRRRQLAKSFREALNVWFFGN